MMALEWGKRAIQGGIQREADDLMRKFKKKKKSWIFRNLVSFFNNFVGHPYPFIMPAISLLG